MPIADVGGLRLEYERTGAGEPVLLIQPTWWPLDPWKRHQVPALATRHEVVTYNLRGLGASHGTADASYTVVALADDAAALLGALGIARAHVVGFAIGGVVGLTLAHRHPERVGGLVVAAAGMGGVAADGGVAARRRTRDEAEHLGLERYYRSHAENDDFAFSSEFYRTHPEEVAALSDALWQAGTSVEELVKHATARATYELGEWVGEVRAPTLVLVGAEDRVRRGSSTPVDAARWLAGQLPETKLVELPGVKHMLFWEAPFACNAAVLDFLGAHPL